MKTNLKPPAQYQADRNMPVIVETSSAIVGWSDNVFAMACSTLKMKLTQHPFACFHIFRMLSYFCDRNIKLPGTTVGSSQLCLRNQHSIKRVGPAAHPGRAQRAGNRQINIQKLSPLTNQPVKLQGQTHVSARGTSFGFTIKAQPVHRFYSISLQPTEMKIPNH